MLISLYLIHYCHMETHIFIIIIIFVTLLMVLLTLFLSLYCHIGGLYQTHCRGEAPVMFFFINMTIMIKIMTNMTITTITTITTIVIKIMIIMIIVTCPLPS